MNNLWDLSAHAACSDKGVRGFEYKYSSLFHKSRILVYHPLDLYCTFITCRIRKATFYPVSTRIFKRCLLPAYISSSQYPIFSRDVYYLQLVRPLNLLTEFRLTNIVDLIAVAYHPASKKLSAAMPSRITNLAKRRSTRSYCYPASVANHALAGMIRKTSIGNNTRTRSPIVISTTETTTSRKRIYTLTEPSSRPRDPSISWPATRS